MASVTVLLALVISFALIFDFVNGFHDTANAIATVVSTRVLSPAAAILMAGVLNFAGALIATRVAKTIASGLTHTEVATQTVVLSAIMGAIVWNLITWRYGIPSSSSHAIIGGLCGAAYAHAGPEAVIWSGLREKVIVPLFASPIAGGIVGFILMTAIILLLADSRSGRVGTVFRRLQILSSAAMAFSHGQNDAQKSMGIITLALVSAGLWPAKGDIPIWVILACAVTMGLGTSAGGWRIIKTVGHRIIRLEPVHGFAAETSGAAVILTASHFGMPISTTHVISGSIFGVGVSKRLSAVRWKVAFGMIIAWVITIPISGALGALFYSLLTAAGTPK